MNPILADKLFKWYLNVAIAVLMTAAIVMGSVEIFDFNIVQYVHNLFIH